MGKSQPLAFHYSLENKSWRGGEFFSRKGEGKIFLKQVFTSIGNCGSGVILCGMDPENRNKVMGFRSDNDLKEKFINNATIVLESILPRLYPIFHEVPVANYL